MDPRKPCKPMILSWGGRETHCFWPDEIDEAEARLPFDPVQPLDVVREHADLSLTQVLLNTDAGMGVGKPLVGITYIFGNIPGSSSGIPDPAPAQPEFVVVHERVTLGDRKQELSRTEYHSGVPGSRESRTTYGNWEYFASLRRGILLRVTSNLGKAVVGSIGQVIASADDAH